ncbi:hypothetical protein [Amycolatopsis sp. lyj-112]|uniref:hypothetical protein n=1 Tax=Amycolatopsis sp. lyj-112 TaxID=2789288 RepID=UPI00397C4835
MPRKKTWLKPVIRLGILGGQCRKTECGPDANFKVVGKQENKSEIGLKLSGGTDCDDLKNPGQRPPVVGDCLPGDVNEAKKMVKADCAAAGYKVLAVEKKPAVSYGDDTCAHVPSTDAKLFWHRPGTALPQERVLCLDKIE